MEYTRNFGAANEPVFGALWLVVVAVGEVDEGGVVEGVEHAVAVDICGHFPPAEISCELGVVICADRAVVVAVVAVSEVCEGLFCDPAVPCILGFFDVEHAVAVAVVGIGGGLHGACPLLALLLALDFAFGV